jgi:serine-type D-Ala-D-Ala carboxypeptidase (penicillin-binding protein 5/6)
MLTPETQFGPKRKKRLPLVLIILISLFLVPAATNNIEATTDTTTLPDISVQLSDTTSYLSVKDDARRPLVYAKSVLLMNAETGEELWSDNADEVVAVASTTKMTTALTARKLLKLDEVVTVTRSSVLVAGSKIQLAVGERITVENLLKGLLIQSGNDTAFALAEHYGQKHGGDYKLFVSEMNKFSEQNNLTLSKYNDPAGLDDEVGRSTARTLAHTARLLLRDPVLSEIVRTPTETIYSVDNKYSHELKNSNRLLLADTPYYMPGAIGIKTGFTHGAGHCLVAGYKTSVGTVIGVVLNTNEYTITASAAEMKKLFQWAENNVLEKSY